MYHCSAIPTKMHSANAISPASIIAVGMVFHLLTFFARISPPPSEFIPKGGDIVPEQPQICPILSIAKNNLVKCQGISCAMLVPSIGSSNPCGCALKVIAQTLSPK